MNPHTRRLRRQRRKGRAKIRAIAAARKHQAELSRAWAKTRAGAKALDQAGKIAPAPPEPAAPLSGGRLLAAMLSQGIKT